MRGERHLASIAAVLDVFEDGGEHLVFLGGCVPALYARPTGAPIRPTKDVDCMSMMVPWILQEQELARLCAFKRLTPVAETQFRYQIPGSDLLIDVMSPDGFNIGGGTQWLREAASHAASHVLSEGRIVRVITPPYFVVLKLAAFLDRGPDLMAGKDMEDLVFIALEVDGLSDHVRKSGLSAAVASLWQKVFSRHSIDQTFIPDIVDYHLHRQDAERRGQAIATLAALATGSVATGVVPESRHTISEHQLHVGDLETEVRIRLWVHDPPTAGVWFIQSHHIKTPEQLAPYHPSRPWADDEAGALAQARRGFTSFYEQAVQAGRVPSEAWLIPNQDF